MWHRLRTLPGESRPSSVVRSVMRIVVSRPCRLASFLIERLRSSAASLARRAVALVHKPDYASIYEQLGVDVSVSPRLICADRILSFIRAESVSTIASIEEGKAVVLELQVKPGSKLVGKSFAKSGFPRSSVVAAVSREDGEVVIPRGETEIRALDNLVIFTLRDVRDSVMSLLGVKAG